MRSLLRALLFLAVAIAALPWLVYVVGLRSLPADRSPESADGLPPQAAALFWSHLGGGSTRPAMARLSPHTSFVSLGAPGYMVPYHAANALLERSREGPVS